MDVSIVCRVFKVSSVIAFEEHYKH